MLLAPNVSATGPSNNNNDSATQTIVMSGAASFENLFLINGVVVNENVRGQALPLFIEDAIQETTVTTGAISAEFGRFSGGVVNAITKSGGNRMSGSFRTTLTNDGWRELSPFAGDFTVDDVIPTYEFTVGGPVVRDRLWYFGAGRFVDRIEARQGDVTGVGYDFGQNEKRFEAKGTYSLAGAHTLRGSFIGRRREETNARQFNIMDTRSLYNRKLPEDLYSANYTGIIRQNFFVEAQFSQARTGLRRRRRVHDRPHRRHARGGLGAQHPVLVADLLLGLCPAGEARQREPAAQGQLLPLDQPRRVAQPGVRLRHVQRRPDREEPPVRKRLPHSRHHLDCRRRRRVSIVGPGSEHAHSMEPDHAEQPGHRLPHPLAVCQRHVAGERSAQPQPRDAVGSQQRQGQRRRRCRQGQRLQPAPRRDVGSDRIGPVDGERQLWPLCRRHREFDRRFELAWRTGIDLPLPLRGPGDQCRRQRTGRRA